MAMPGYLVSSHLVAGGCCVIAASEQRFKDRGNAGTIPVVQLHTSTYCGTHGKHEGAQGLRNCAVGTAQ